MHIYMILNNELKLTYLNKPLLSRSNHPLNVRFRDKTQGDLTNCTKEFP